MRKRNKKEDVVLIDLQARGKIKIIHSSKKEVSIKEMKEFEGRLMTRYNEYCEFTELCIKRNLEKKQENFSRDTFTDAMKSILEQNELLKNMIDLEE